MPVALEHAPVVELELKLPGGGGPGDHGPDDRGGGGGGDRDDERRRGNLYRFGLALTLISITTLFATLCLIYYVRSRAPDWWEPITPPRALWLSTGILLTSSAMLELARRALRERRWFVYRRRLALTSFLGFAFLASQLMALTQLAEQGVFLAGNPHASLFWVFTGAHGLHLLGGMIAINCVVFRRKATWQRHRLLISVISTYWHFMGVIWLALFAILLML
jgi:cytochrome c oxidase subunit 3